MWEPSSTIITTAGQTIIVGETITRVWELLKSPQWHFIELHQLVKTDEKEAWSPDHRWDVKPIILNTENITTIVPWGPFEIHKGS